MNRMASTWKSNEHAKGISGERRLAGCWGGHSAIANFAWRVYRSEIRSQRKIVSAEHRNQHATSVRSPDSAIAAAVDVPIMTTRWTRKDLIGLREMTADEINFVLETTDAFKQVGTREIKKVPALRGKTLVNFFVEPSTRTRTSFELAALRLSADVINISATTSSLTKGETLKDTARNLEALHADIIVLRHSSAGAPQFLASRLKTSVINAGDGAHEHPTQALLDLYTIRERRSKIAGLHVAIIGDILFSRVARSNIFGLLKLGARVTLVGPSTLVPREFEKLGAEVSHKIEDVLPTADVVNLLRIQHERQRREYFPGLGEYIRLFGLTKKRAKLLKPDCLIMHPGPINRGVEIDSEVADGRQSVILDQVTNGLAVRMAVLYLCGGIAT
jgi:aspartate carbamoyltransferase catalytic subunit